MPKFTKEEHARIEGYVRGWLDALEALHQTGSLKALRQFTSVADQDIQLLKFHAEKEAQAFVKGAV